MSHDFRLQISRRNASIRSTYTVLVVILIFLCTAIVFGIIYALGLPAQAEKAFGKPSSKLNTWQKISLSVKLLQQQDALSHPGNPSAAMLPFEIAKDESTASIIKRLQAGGIITDPSLFTLYLQFKGQDTSIQAGKYDLSAAMSPIQIAFTLQDATPKEINFNILRGWRVEEIAAAIPTSGLEFPPDAFLQIARIRPPGYSFSEQLPVNSKIVANGSPYPVEGFLLPDTYTLPRDASPVMLMTAILQNFDKKVDATIRQGIAEQDLSIYEGITLASIIEHEAMLEDEEPTIASVYLNRITSGMKLEADPTIQFAVGAQAGRGWWPSPLTVTDLETDSPYNTYLYDGLPPSPIGSPTLSAIRAVAFPASSGYFYFRALCDGSGKHAFAQTYEEHVQNACR